MTSKTLSITEPHPSVPKSKPTTYVSAGRGGAGNFKRYKPEDLTSGPNATGPPSRISLMKGFKNQGNVTLGRGGAGNIYKQSQPEERVFQFDEEMVKRRDSQASPVYHIGRGGAANYVDERDEQRSRITRIDSTGSGGSISSEESTTSNVRGTLGKLVRRFS